MRRITSYMVLGLTLGMVGCHHVSGICDCDLQTGVGCPVRQSSPAILSTAVIVSAPAPVVTPVLVTPPVVVPGVTEKMPPPR